MEEYIEKVLEGIGFSCSYFLDYNERTHEWIKYLLCEWRGYRNDFRKYAKFRVTWYGDTYYFRDDSVYDEHLQIALGRNMIESHPEIIMKDTCDRFYRFWKYGNDFNRYQDSLFE